VSVSEWREVTLGDVCDSVSNTHPFEKAKLIFLNTSDVYDGSILHNNYSPVAEMPGQAKKSIKKGDILYSEIRPKNKRYAMVNFDASDYVVSTKFMVIRSNGLIVNKFLYLYLTSNEVLETLQQVAEARSGTFPQITFSQVAELKLNLPPIPEQKAIVATLSALDDMIELNNKINKTLEEMAQAIFKSWFVDFEPFKDGEFENSELGLIPKGWRVGMLGDFVEIVDNRGKTPPLSDVKTEYPIIDVRALSGESRVIDYSNCTKYVEKEIYDSWFRSGHPKHLDILISTVGSIAEMKMFYGNKGCIAQNVVAFRSNGISPCYLYQYLQYSKGDLLSYNIGSVQPSIKVTHVIKYKIIVPDEKTMSSFDMLMESISDQIHRNANESQILIAIRDTLLPKLISGEIRVPVEEVV
jgi:type I restriction enzyme S subunit